MAVWRREEKEERNRGARGEIDEMKQAAHCEVLSAGFYHPDSRLVSHRTAVVSSLNRRDISGGKLTGGGRNDILRHEEKHRIDRRSVASRERLGLLKVMEGSMNMNLLIELACVQGN